MSQDIILTGNLDMLHSLYDFKATYAKTLSFKNNEYFLLHQTNTKHKNWWEVINERGEMGYIPSNYVENVTVNPSFYVQFLDNCLEHLRKNDASSECSIGNRNEVILRLKELKRQVEQLPEISRNSIGADYDDIPPLLFQNSDGKLEPIKTMSTSSYSSNLSEIKNSHSVIEEPIKPVQKGISRESVQKSIENIHEEIKSEIHNDHKKSESNISTSNSSNISPAITHQSVYELVESVRINTQLSHEMSRVAVLTVIQGLHELLPASVFPYLSTILSHSQTTLVDDVQIDQTHDASRLKIIFNELTSCKEDSQQRSWMLHEDEIVIKEYITELISILSNADASISRHVISSDQYHVITTLIQYYQMEIRWSIRQLLLQAFGVLCSLDKTVINIMLNSVLPGELARYMVYHKFIGKHFLAFVLDNIEYPPDTDLDEQIPDLFLNLIISYNLQFTEEKENPVLAALEDRDVAKTFTEKILLLINREEDPVRIFDHEPAPPHSLLKLFNDLFSRRSTAELFYTNDVKVLIDIIVRNISDLSPGDMRRQQYLELCRRVMKNTNYEEHKHKIDEILKCFTRIFCEESDLSKYDQKLVKDISNEFPHLFK
ncbi:hypothetical protein NQ314_014078 [Rhamnusium bicolor]|uniref:SH3 domain-containing protein n=1 Tax=Rhamnusium bicolor TaxID=1586634 RepID=A0AAV8X3Z9_9CUCU|nr:hypothetical protein NQ314_014078 [Rhamnusium bicolor]